MPQLKAYLANKHDVDLAVSDAKPSAIAASTKIAFLQVGDSTKLSKDDAKALRTWAEAGGTLWIDAVAGTPAAVAAVDAIAGQLDVSADLKSLSKSELMTGDTLAGGHPVTSGLLWRTFTHAGAGKPSIQATFGAKARPEVIVVRGDLTCGLAGLNHWMIAGLTPTAARELVANSVLEFLPRVSPTTQSSTRPTTQSATQPTTQPTTRPSSPQPATSKTAG
jgi:hypothetical protein